MKPVPRIVYDYGNQCYVKIVDAVNANAEDHGDDFYAYVEACGHRTAAPDCFSCQHLGELVRAKNSYTAEQRAEAARAFDAFGRALPGADPGDWMYMGRTNRGLDMLLSFKHRDTRLYIYVSESWADPARAEIPQPVPVVSPALRRC